MTCDIFIKSYSKDFPWLRYCLKSIRRFCSGFGDVWLVVDACDEEELCDLGIKNEIVICVEPKEPGYLFQQWIKLNADKWSDADYIAFVDSDCHFIKAVTPESFFKEGRPVMLITRYSSLGNNVPWRDVTEKTLGFSCEWETMRRHPIVCPRFLLAALRNHFGQVHNVNLEQYILSSPKNCFSEFNMLGSYALAKHPDAFHWLDTALEPLPETVLVQHWSHGGLLTSISTQIEAELL